MPKKFTPKLVSPEQIALIKEFKEKTIAHMIVKEKIVELMNAILAPVEEMIFLVGPTRAGKTTLVNKVTEMLFEYTLTDPSFHPGRIATALMTIPGDTTFNWKLYYQIALVALREILITKKVSYRVELDELGRLLSRHDNTKYTFRDQYIKTLNERDPYSFFVDEAHDILRKPRDETNRSLMDIFKSLIFETRTIHVLVGTYDLLDLIDNKWSAQLDCRTKIIHFRRFDCAATEDKASYTEMLKAVPSMLHPIAADFSFEANAAYFDRNTLGVVGMLMIWIEGAMRNAFAAGRDYLSYKDMENTRISDERLKSRKKEIVDGEEKLAKFQEQEESEQQKRDGKNGIKPALTNGNNSNGGKSRKRTQPGRRKSGRDPIAPEESDEI